MRQLVRAVVAVTFVAATALWLYSGDGSTSEWVGFFATGALGIAVGAAFDRRGVVLIALPTLMAIPLGTTNYDSGVPDAVYVFVYMTPVLLVLLLVGMGLRRVINRLAHA
jgi:hypothetical protein